MPKPKRTPREEIERAFHVSFKLPEQAAELLDAYRDQVLSEAAELIEAESAKGLHIRYGSATDYAEHYASVLRAAKIDRPEPRFDVTEALRVRLWLIEQALTPIDVQQDPAGIVGIVGPYLDGPIHPTDTAAYRAARATREG